MIILQLIALWLIVPATLYVSSALYIRRLRRERQHDLILYTLCDARDLAAVKAVRGEIDERSQIFRYFYKELSEIIHDHKGHPIGFAHLAKNLAENKNRPPPTWVLSLIRELKKSDAETKQMVMRYIDGVQLIRKQDSLISFLDKLPRWVGERGVLLPRRQRSFARFNRKLATTVGYQSVGLCPVGV